MKASKLVKNLTEFIGTNGDMDVFVRSYEKLTLVEVTGFQKNRLLSQKDKDISGINPLGTTFREVIVINSEK